MFGKLTAHTIAELNNIEDKKQHTFLTMERCGVFFVYLSAVILHFIFDWSKSSVIAALFGAVNESTWEHIKIFAFPYAAWSLIELLYIRTLEFKKFVAAKTLSLYFLIFSIPIFFYTYSSIIGKNITIVDILSGLLLTIMTFYISYTLKTKCENIGRYYRISLFLLCIYYIAHFFLTALAPHFFLFKDPITGGYGIP